jgi:hypothetical protein
MKRILPIVLLAAIGTATVFTACKKSDDEEKKEETKPVYTCTSCNTTPEAIAANDSSSKGIYKGTVVGSTGTIKFNVANNGSTIGAVLTLDGVTANLTSSIAWVEGEPYVAPFTGTLNGQQVSITFSVSVNGGSPTITSSEIPGHPNAAFTLVKETSSALIEVFEGTYSTTKPETGTFNLVLSRSLKRWGGTAKKDSNGQTSDVDGTIGANGEMINSDNNVNMGTLSGDNISGSFKDSEQRTVTITAKRTL